MNTSSGETIRAPLMLRSEGFQFRPEFERTRPSVYSHKVADGRLSYATCLCDLDLRHAGADHFGYQRLPIHHKPFNVRFADIVHNGLPNVNIGRLLGMEKPERKRTEFGKRMHAARKATKPKELTQAFVCEQLGISQGTLSELETKANGSSKTTEFAKLYGVNAHWLATGEGSMRPGGPVQPEKPPKGFTDRRQVSPSQWALLQAVEDLVPEKEREELVSRHQRTRERIIAELRESSEVRGMSMPMPLDEQEEEKKRKGGAS